MEKELPMLQRHSRVCRHLSFLLPTDDNENENRRERRRFDDKRERRRFDDNKRDRRSRFSEDDEEDRPRKFVHNEEFSKRVVKFREPQLSKDSEIRFNSIRRRGWKKNNNDDNSENK